LVASIECRGVPAGMLYRATSTPLMYTIAPSSTFRRRSPPSTLPSGAAGSVTVLRK
jgi:hypothetical protein